MTDTGTRINACLTNSACRMAGQGEISIHAADSLFGKTLGFSDLGIFGSADAIGLDSILAACEDAQIEPAELLMAAVSKGMLGGKTPDTGGFYKTAGGKRLVIDPQTLSHAPYDAESAADAALPQSSSIALRQRALFFNEPSKAVWTIISDMLTLAISLIPETSASIAETDFCMRTNYGWLTGPFEFWDNISLWPVLDRLKNEGRPIHGNAQRMMICGAEKFYRIKDGQKQYFHFDSRTYKDIPDNFL